MKTIDTNGQQPPARSSTPTAFELAQLALMLETRLPADPEDQYLPPPEPGTWPNPNFKDAVRLAMDLWEEADMAVQNKQDSETQLRELSAGVFTMDPDEWNARIDNYKGHPITLNRLLDGKCYRRGEIERQLFRDKTWSRNTRAKALSNLIGHGVRRGVRTTYRTKPSDGWDEVCKKSLASGSVSMRICRWLVEVRQHQISENRKRDYVPHVHRMRVA